LADILREVRKRTGASIDFPANATERVVAMLGPAPPREVLAALLEGSSFNYVLVGSVSDPGALSSVTITGKSGTGEVQMAAIVDPPSSVNTPPDRAELGPATPPGRFFPGARMMPPHPGAPSAAAPQVADDDDSADADQDEADNQGQNAATTPPDNPLGLQHGSDSMQQNLEKIQQMRQQQGQPTAPPNN
jgi:hypothetical protein